MSPQPAARRRILPPRIAIATAALITIIALGVVIYVNTNHGRLVIESKADDVKVIVESGGGKVTIIDPQAEREVKLSPGEYGVRLEDEKAGLSLSTKSFTIKRGDEVVVEVRYEPKVAEAQPSADDAARWKLGPAEDVMVGVVPRPAKLPGIRRWQIETAMPRSNIKSVAYSPDGEVIACGTSNGQVRLYDAETMQIVRLLSLQKGEVFSVAWSPDGQWLATSSRDKTVQLWNSDGTLGQTFRHQEYVHAICWSPDGKQLACTHVSRTGDVLVWNLEGKQRLRLECSSAAFAVSWSPDGQRIAVGHRDSTLRLWTADGELLKELEGHEGDVRSVAWSPGGGTLASGSSDGTVRLWSSNGTPGQVLKAHGYDVHAVAWSPDGKTLAASSISTVNLWDSEGNPGPVIGFRAGLGGNVFSLSWSPDSKRIVTGGDNNRIHVWDASGQQDNSELSLHGHQSRVESVAFSPDGQQLASGGWDGMVRVWSADGRKQVSHKGHRGRVYTVTWNTDGKRFASGGSDHTIRLWHLDGRTNVVLKHNDEVRAATWSADGRFVASVDRDRTAYVWDLKDTKKPRILNEQEGATTALAWNPADQLLAIGSLDGTVRFWTADGTPGLVIKCNDDKVKPLAWRRDGEILATATESGNVQLWSKDGVKGKVINMPGPLYSIAWKPDGKSLVAATGQSIRIWRSTGIVGPKINGHRGEVLSVNWSSNGRQIASDSIDGTIIVWDADAEQPEWVGVPLNDGQAASFTAAGQLLYGDPELIEKEFVYVIETDDGKLELLSRSEFLKRVGSAPATTDTSKK